MNNDETKINNATPSAPLEKPQDAEPSPVPAKDIPQTKGEKFYDRMIVTSTYAGTFGASLASAYFFKHHPTGVGLLKTPKGWLEKKLSENPAIGGSDPAGRANNAIVIGSLMAGGTSVAVPFKMLEDKRKDIIQNYNDKHGTGIEDPKLEALAQKRIDAIPLQSWQSAAAGRGLAMGLTLAFGVPTHTGKPIEAAQEWVAKKMNRSPLSVGNIIRPKYANKPFNDENRAYTIDNNIIMDGTWSAFTSAVLLAGSRLTAKATGKEEYHHDEEPNGGEINSPTHDGTIELAEHSLQK